MAELEEGLVVGQNPLDEVEVAARDDVAVDARHDLERHARRERESIAGIIFVDVVGVLLLGRPHAITSFRSRIAGPASRPFAKSDGW